MIAKFDQDHASFDGGAILLQACDRRLGLTEALIGGIDDRRQSGKIQHAIGDLLRQRLYAIACGYPDGNDAGRLGADPVQKLLCGRDPVRGEHLASQPTLSRFENAFDRADMYRMGIALSETVLERHACFAVLRPCRSPITSCSGASTASSRHPSAPWCGLPRRNGTGSSG